MTAALTATALIALSAAAFAAPGDHPPANRGAAGDPKASVGIGQCTSAAMYADRRLEFRGSMSSIGAGGTMQMRFTLYRRYNESHSKRMRVVRPTDGGSLGQWLGSTDPTATTYIHNLSVTPVETYATYRAKVQFRWLNASGTMVARTKRTSRLCKQKTGLPNLEVSGVQRYPNTGTVYPQMPAAYAVTIRNTGRSSAALQSGFMLAGQAGGDLVDGTIETTPLNPFDTIPARSSIVRTLYGPECHGGLAVRVDPRKMVRETSDRDNAYNGPC
jgi:hypothetical protein